MGNAICWFRQDLRIEDNPAWAKAAACRLPVIPVFIWSPGQLKDGTPGAAGRWWLHHALEDLSDQLRSIGHELIIRRGDTPEELNSLIEESGAQAVYWNRCYEPGRLREDGIIKKRLKETGIEVWTGNSALLREPWKVSTQAGNPYKVYTPFAKACRAMDEAAPVTNSSVPACAGEQIATLQLDELGLLTGHSWEDKLADHWIPSRQAGLQRLRGFLSGPVADYDNARDYPSVDGVSRLSPYLHWGQIGPREVVSEMARASSSSGLKVFYDELLWREFAHHILYHFPETPHRPLQLKFETFPWLEDKETLEAWKFGKTGYPIVDAGMRELWQTGWMHNRSRMIVGSFLVKHLLQSWEEGARWFWDTLVDADLANNTLGWQWIGGCGADAAPYFRIFNPILQGEKFDQDGDYIKRFVPELESVPGKYIHTPWEMPDSIQEASKCIIGKDYPFPVIEHRKGRERALEALSSIREGN